MAEGARTARYRAHYRLRLSMSTLSPIRSLKRIGNGRSASIHRRVSYSTEASISVFPHQPAQPETDLPFQKTATNLPVNSTEIATLEIGSETQKPPHRWLFYSRVQVAAYYNRLVDLYKPFRWTTLPLTSFPWTTLDRGRQAKQLQVKQLRMALPHREGGGG
jgi:hypothetical protein